MKKTIVLGIFVVSLSVFLYVREMAFFGSMVRAN